MKLIDQSTRKAAEALKSLGHPMRIEILRILNNKKQGKISVKHIHESLGLTQSETSRHLIVLKNASVLECLKEGNSSYYYINDNHSFIQCLAACLKQDNEKKK